MALGAVRVLGWLVIAHALAHAVLPLRGSLAPAMLIDDWVPVGLYAIAMVGFSAAGLGLLGLRPLDRAISPVLVVSSALSLVAIVRLGDPTLKVGAVSDVLLLLTGLWRSRAGWPVHRVPGARPVRHHLGHALAAASGFVFLGYVAVASAILPWHRTWGSTAAELRMPLPGDPADRQPACELQHAVTIDAPPEQVWPWLIQRGPARGGFASDDSRLRDLQPGRALVLDHGAFVLLPTATGGTRFIIRSTVGHPGIAVWAAALEFMTFELPHFVRERRMMLTIKALAEQHGRQEAAAR